MEKNKFSPIRLYLIWILICLSLTLFIPLLSVEDGSSAGIPLVVGFYIIAILILGLFIISILNMFLFKELAKKFKYVNGTIAVVLGTVIIYFLWKIIAIND